MKAHLIDTHLLVPRSRSSAKIKVKYQGHLSQRMGVAGALVFHKHILFFFFSSPEHKVLMVSFVIAQCPVSVIRHVSSTISLTTRPILIKLGRDVSWVKLYQSCSGDWIPIITEVAMATKMKKIAKSLKIFFSETRGHRALIFGM